MSRHGVLLVTDDERTAPWREGEHEDVGACRRGLLPPSSAIAVFTVKKPVRGVGMAAADRVWRGPRTAADRAGRIGAISPVDSRREVTQQPGGRRVVEGGRRAVECLQREGRHRAFRREWCVGDMDAERRGIRETCRVGRGQSAAVGPFLREGMERLRPRRRAAVGEGPAERREAADRAAPGPVELDRDPLDRRVWRGTGIRDRRDEILARAFRGSPRRRRRPSRTRRPPRGVVFDANVPSEKMSNPDRPPGCRPPWPSARSSWRACRSGYRRCS